MQEKTDANVCSFCNCFIMTLVVRERRCSHRHQCSVEYGIEFNGQVRNQGMNSWNQRSERQHHLDENSNWKARHIKLTPDESNFYRFADTAPLHFTTLGTGITKSWECTSEIDLFIDLSTCYLALFA